MFVEIELSKDSYSRRMSKEKFEVIKEHFYPDIEWCVNSTWNLPSDVVSKYYRSLAPDDWAEYDSQKTDTKPTFDKWLEKNCHDSDEKDEHYMNINMMCNEPQVKCPDSITVDIDLWLEHWKWPYNVIRTVNVKEKYKNEGEVISHLKHILNTVDEKLMNLNHISEKVSQMTFNQQCDVHMGGGFLMRVNRLQLLEDVCTDYLQEELNKGWRIISVNVQPDQRRSDYVLGMYDEGYEHDASGAKRKS